MMLLPLFGASVRLTLKHLRSSTLRTDALPVSDPEDEEDGPEPKVRGVQGEGGGWSVAQC